MKLAFMSSVWPAATTEQLIAAGKEHGYRGIEFRPEWKHQHGIELTASSGERKRLRKLLADNGLDGCCISPGCRFNQEEPVARDAELTKLLEYVHLAAEMGIPRIRVFADPLPRSGYGKRAEAYRTHADYFGRAADVAAKVGVRIVLETHLNCRAFDVGEILFHAGYPAALWINWHLQHCLNHGEDVDEAYRHVKGRVAHVHFALDDKESEMPSLLRQIQLLHAEGYDGYFSVEVINPPEHQPVLVKHAAAWERLKSHISI